MYLNEPSLFRVYVPWEGPLARTAVSGFPSTSESLLNTPGAATWSIVSSSVLNASFEPTGAILDIIGSPVY